MQVPDNEIASKQWNIPPYRSHHVEVDNQLLQCRPHQLHAFTRCISNGRVRWNILYYEMFHRTRPLLMHLVLILSVYEKFLNDYNSTVQ